jgi:hypothetical protein
LAPAPMTRIGAFAASMRLHRLPADKQQDEHRPPRLGGIGTESVGSWAMSSGSSSASRRAFLLRQPGTPPRVRARDIVGSNWRLVGYIW